MSFFSDKSSYLGVDLGSSSVKVVELANFNSRPKLVTYGFTEKKLDNWHGDNSIGEAEEMAKVLAEVCRKAKTNAKKAIAALPSFSIFSSILNLPEMPKKELASAISWEAKKIIPVPLDEIILDWKVVGESEIEKANPSVASNGGSELAAGLNQQAASLRRIFSRPQKNLKILLTGASKALVKKYINIFSQAGLSLLSLETESFAMIRALVGNDKSVMAVVDVGATTSSIIIVNKGVPVLSRSIDVGGLMITHAVANSLNVSLERAEQFKQDLSLDSAGAENSLPRTVAQAFSVILNEIKYTINLYQEQNNKKIEKMILTGGSSMLGNLSGYLSQQLNLNTYLGDPWARVIYPTELKPVLDRLGARFAVAIGLAMRDIG